MSTPRRRPAARRGEGEKLRAEILDVTARMLEESGDASTLSLRAIARETGVAATSIYLHFDSLETLVRAVKEQKYEELREVLQAADTAAPDDPPRRLHAATKAYVDFALERPGTYKVLFGTSVDLPPDGEGRFIGERAFQVAVEVLASTRKSRDDAYLGATQLWCAMHGMVTLRALHPNFPWPSVDDQIDDLIERLFLS
ncbi:TetR/AcrR family transcriptional regulator [Nocardioidaceae bacterium SCSIO 66511]|nr:TetR/AcrR family transcriptional regulator [Nocardioidaceae bacterium SCSIO 66511]